MSYSYFISVSHDPIMSEHSLLKVNIPFTVIAKLRRNTNRVRTMVRYSAIDGRSTYSFTRQTVPTQLLYHTILLSRYYLFRQFHR